MVARKVKAKAPAIRNESGQFQIRQWAGGNNVTPTEDLDRYATLTSHVALKDLSLASTYSTINCWRKLNAVQKKNGRIIAA
jgi:hypothetical protein